MKIAFNPSNSSKNILDLIKNNKDIIFDLKGHSIYARGVEFKGTDTNTWRPVVDNLTSNSATSSLSANQGRVLAGLINGKSDSDHNHDDRYLKLIGGTLTGNLVGTSAMFSGRFYGSGDDEGIIIKPSSNGYAGLILGAHDGERSIFYFVKNKPFWRYSHGSDNLDIIHPKKSGTIALTSDIPDKNSWNYDDRYYTKAESDIKYITDITTSVNKLTFTKNGSNIARDITVNIVRSQGNLTNISDKNATTKASSGLVIYNSYNQTIGTNPYSSVLSINTGGTIQIAGNWGDYTARNLYWRSQSDRNVADYPWKSWRTILDNENYSSTLDSRYYTETEVNSLLDAKLNRQNLSYGTWNPRGYHLAADYHYNGGDLSISESGGQIHVSVDGYFWQNEGRYRVLDTSDVAGLKGDLTVHQYLSNTDTTWWPLIWGGSSHANTSDSTGAVYKSHDKLSWQTSSQILYATNIQTENIKHLSIGGGIYWNPNVESATNGSDAASITLVKSGVAGGTTLVLSQMNDANDTIQFQTNGSARLYHNSYPILTTQNTYVSNNKGYINGTEITQVNNADKVDNRHAISTIPNTGIIYKAAIYTSSSLTSYWVRLASINQNNEFVATIHVQSGHSNPGRSAILLVYLRGAASSLSKSFKICCNSNYDPNRFRLYYKDSDKTSEIWYQTTGQWDGIITTVISQSSEGSLYEGLTLYSGSITAVQTPSMSTYLSAQVSTITDNISGNASTATKLATPRKIWGQSFDGTADVDNTLRIRHTTGNYCEGIRIQTGDGAWSTIILGATADSGTNANAWSIHRKSDNNFAISRNSSDGANGLVMTPTGMGLGTTSPTQRLDVAGNIRTTGNLYISHATNNNMNHDTSNPRIVFSESGSQAVALVYTDYDSYRHSKGLKVMDVDNEDPGNVWFEVQGYNYSSGYVKNGSNNNYILLGGGGHKAISDFASSSHSHNYAANENYGGFTKSGRLPISGFYQSYESESGGNAPWSSWMHLINCQHSNTNNNYALQIAASFYDNNTFKIRVTANSVNNAWRDIIHSGNIGSQTVANAYHLRINSVNTWSTWYWAGQGGQPSWLWGSNDGTNMYVWNPSNFRVAYASSAGNADTVDGEHASNFVRAGNFESANLNSLDTYSFIKSVNSTVASASPGGYTGWYNVIQAVHRNGSGDGPGYIGQIALGMTTNINRMFYRTKYKGSWYAWNEVVTTNTGLLRYSRNNVNISSSNCSPIPPSLLEWTVGYPRLYDPEFNEGDNNVWVYNNAGNGVVTVTRVHDTNVGNSSSYVMKVVSAAGAIPNYGGWHVATQTELGKVYTCLFRARIPSGVEIEWNSNSIGTGGQMSWLTNNMGTDKWTWYAVQVYCGSGGSTTFFFSAKSPCTWYLSYVNVIENNRASYAGLRSVYSDYLKANASIVFERNELQYFNQYTGVTAGATNNANPKTDWYHILRMNHANNSGYFVDLAIPFFDNRIQFRRITSGSDNGWRRVITEEPNHDVILSEASTGGNVGIGINNPAYKLDVNGQMRAEGFHHWTVNSDNYMLLAGGGYKSFGGDDSNPVFLGYLNLDHGNDGTISSSFSCLGYSVPFTYTRGGSYCRIQIPDTTHQVFYIRAATASVHYSGGGMDTWTGVHRGSGAWWLHCYAQNANEVRVKGFCQNNSNNDSWWGGNPLWSGNDGANRITVCIFGYVKFR